MRGERAGKRELVRGLNRGREDEGEGILRGRGRGRGARLAKATARDRYRYLVRLPPLSLPAQLIPIPAPPISSEAAEKESPLTGLAPAHRKPTHTTPKPKPNQLELDRGSLSFPLPLQSISKRTFIQCPRSLSPNRFPQAVHRSFISPRRGALQSDLSDPFPSHRIASHRSAPSLSHPERPKDREREKEESCAP